MQFAPLPTFHLFKNLTGLKFGRLLVLGYWGRSDAGQHKWLCKCDCGTEKAILGRALGKGGTISCGCFARKAVGERNRKHGLHSSRAAQHPLFNVWRSMRRRCCKPTHPQFFRYGARGIKVCERWMTSFANFVSDMGPRPERGLSIERIDNNGNYTPENCRWATVGEQANNRRTNKRLTVGGASKTVSQWARTSGLNRGTIEGRLRNGWGSERAIKTPVMNHRI